MVVKSKASGIIHIVLNSSLTEAVGISSSDTNPEHRYQEVTSLTEITVTMKY